nr:type II secretion system F family protein [Tessaracoccus bendigoensis]
MSVLGVGGVMGLVAGLRQVPVATGAPKTPRLQARLASVPRRVLISGLLAAVVGVLVALLSGWVIAIVLFPLAAIGLPVLLGVSDESHTIERLEGLAEWTRNLAGVITVGVGLEGALVATLRTTPDVIRPEVTTLVSRIRSRWNTAEALRAFADQFNDSTGDLVAATLILAAQKRADGLAQILSGLAESVSAEVAARRHLEADRSKPRQTARIVTIITVVCLVGMAATGQYLEPYRSPLGQIVLSVLLALYVVGLVVMRRMARVKPLPRLLASGGPS